MLGGYTGRILDVDLTRRRVSVRPTEFWDLRSYVGGSGLGARILFDETDETTDPLSPDNVLLFMTGPLVGTDVFSSNRFELVTKSPLTGIYAESDCGGHWGGKLKLAGFDGMIVRGKASSPVYLWVTGGDADIRDASHIWGRDTFDTHEIIRNEAHPEAEVACIGPAGERLARIAAVMTDGPDGRAAARCGVGTVMGSKNLKAIAVFGEEKVRVADEAALRERLRGIAKHMRDDTQVLGNWGTSNGLVICERIGDLPIKNWAQGTWPAGADKICGQTMAETILTRRYHCGKCVIGCGRTVEVKGGKWAGPETGGPEYESLGMLGSNCLVDDLEAIAKANELCNRYGIDTISAGSAVAFAMEAFERGIIGPSDTDGLNLEWGNADVLVELITMIGERKGLGRLLGEGTKNAATVLGKNAEEFAIHVKGLDFPAHDPRAKLSNAVAYATSNRGACHLQAFSYEFENGIAMPEIGISETLDRFAVEGKGRLVFLTQNLMSMFDSLKCCKFTIFGGLTAGPLVDCLNYVTGWDFDIAEFMKTGERIFNLKRLYNVRCGVSRKDDTIPPRILSLMRDGGAEGKLPPLGAMLNEYYRCRGWDEFGIPTQGKLKELGLVK